MAERYSHAIPAKAGIQHLIVRSWTPVCAGVTYWARPRHLMYRNGSGFSRDGRNCGQHAFPAADMAVLVGLVLLDDLAGFVVPVDDREQSDMVAHGLALDPDADLEDRPSAQEAGAEAADHTWFGRVISRPRRRYGYTLCGPSAWADVVYGIPPPPAASTSCLHTQGGTRVYIGTGPTQSGRT